MNTILTVFVVAIALYAIFMFILLLLGKREDARAWGGFIPDCIVLFKRLLGEPSLPFMYKLPVFLLVGYLAFPIDLVPDFIPIAGQLDDAILVALVIRIILKHSGETIVAKNWPGPKKSLQLVLKLARHPQ